MKDERFKQIMKDLGQPDSHSLYRALKQVENETAQEIFASFEKEFDKEISEGQVKIIRD